MSSREKFGCFGGRVAAVLLAMGLFLGGGFARAGGDPCTGKDLDGDGVPESCDVCPGFDDNIDTDGDGIPDGCDPCPNSSEIGDSDGDGDRDWDDYARLANCLAGPGGGLGDGCECFDANENGAVDLRDARQFLNGFSTGPGCNIDGRFVAAGKRDAFPLNCRVCRPSLDPSGWSLVDEGTVCNTGSGDMCDRPEVCDGVGEQCPDDVFASAEALCRPGSGDSCDPDEFCTGVPDEPCPDDGVLQQGIVCRTGSGDMCDPPERCTGVAGEACPDDVVVPQGVICLQGAGDICDPNERCTGIAGEPCPEDRVAEEGTVCNEGSGDMCDPDELCSGIAGEGCPDDRFRPADFVCRAPAGQCDKPEFCTGNPDELCPSDAKRGDETVCRPAAGECDYEEICNGVANVCPPDLRKDSEFECRPKAGPCDEIEACDGVSVDCPPDVLKAAGITCRAAGQELDENGNPVVVGTGECDVAEKCTGESAMCPPDQFKAQGTLCRDRAGFCDREREVCSGSSKDCPFDTGNAGQFIACRPPAGPCDEPEFCSNGDPNYPNCPADALKAEGSLCRDLGPAGSYPNFRACDVQEFCDGASINCPENEFLPIDSVCVRNDGSDGSCQDVGEGRPKCVEAGTVADGGSCTADFECASNNCVETIDRTRICGAANRGGIGDPCDGRNFFYEGDPDQRSCRVDGGDQLWCCKDGLPAATGQIGTCSECCRNDDTRGGTGKGVVGCESNQSRTECCDGRCANLTNDPYNCGECGINCYDAVDLCKPEVIGCDGGEPGTPQPGTCEYTSPCPAGDACWDNCLGCFGTGTCGGCQSVATCYDLNWLMIEAESEFLCQPCSSDSDCGDGLYCQSSCGETDGYDFNIACALGGYCVEVPGDCVQE